MIHCGALRVGSAAYILHLSRFGDWVHVARHFDAATRLNSFTSLSPALSILQVPPPSNKNFFYCRVVFIVFCHFFCLFLSLFSSIFQAFLLFLKIASKQHQSRDVNENEMTNKRQKKKNTAKLSNKNVIKCNKKTK